jgi:hypothetical protein
VCLAEAPLDGRLSWTGGPGWPDPQYWGLCLSCAITAGEWKEALAALEAHGFENGFQQELETANRYYRPDFTDRETPFKDVRDFGA